MKCAGADYSHRTCAASTGSACSCRNVESSLGHEPPATARACPRSVASRSELTGLMTLPGVGNDSWALRPETEFALRHGATCLGFLHRPQKGPRGSGDRSGVARPSSRRQVPAGVGGVTCCSQTRRRRRRARASLVCMATRWMRRSDRGGPCSPFRPRIRVCGHYRVRTPVPAALVCSRASAAGGSAEALLGEILISDLIQRSSRADRPQIVDIGVSAPRWALHQLAARVSAPLPPPPGRCCRWAHAASYTEGPPRISA